MEIKQTCKFFRPDAPCLFHKSEKKECVDCAHYQVVGNLVLLIKKEAGGDVLRTTAALEPLRRKFPEARIIWLTASANQALLKGNSLIDEIWTDDSFDLWGLNLFEFEAVINFDLGYESLVAAGLARTKQRLGFWYEKNRLVRCSNQAAENWFLLSHNDRLKKANKATYQEMLSRVIGGGPFGEIIVPLSEESLRFAESFRQKFHLIGKSIIGINVGRGRRWSTKQWPEEHFLKLIHILTGSYAVVLFGGKLEQDLLEKLLAKSPPSVISAGWDNSLSDFFALLNLCQVVVTSDTLALHTATGLKKKVVALFGPTSSSEIADYGRVYKLVAPVDCICCYRTTCPDYPKCMRAIAPEKVAGLVKELANKHRI